MNLSYKKIVNIFYTTFQRYFKKKILCYYSRSKKHSFEEIFPIMKANNLDEMNGIVLNETFRINAAKRFDLGHRIYYCCDKNNLIAYGWKTGITKSYYSWEIANKIYFNKPVYLLYDSYVNPVYRRRGIQKSLLHARMNDCEEGSLIAVYAEPSNTPSIKAITNCGFKPVGILTHFSSTINPPENI